MIKINVGIGRELFTATLFDDASAQALVTELPMVITLRELNGNEKYFNMTTRLPTDSQRVGSIKGKRPDEVELGTIACHIF